MLENQYRGEFEGADSKFDVCFEGNLVLQKLFAITDFRFVISAFDYPTRQNLRQNRIFGKFSLIAIM